MSDFVAAFGTTGPRRTLLNGLLDYRDMLTSLGYLVGVQFVDGSFVEHTEQRENRTPSDIDVFSFLVRPDRYRTDAALWQNTGFPEWQSQIVDFKLNKQRFGVDSYGVAVDQCGPGTMISSTCYWYGLFSHKRLTHDWKGFVSVSLDAQDDAAARAALVSANV